VSSVGAQLGNGVTLAVSRDRELWLDAVRCIALFRVLAWHAFGAAAITYVVSAVPAMFFVTGSLLAKSLSHRPAHDVLVDRARRVLVPLAAFSAVVIGAMVAAWVTVPSPRTELPWRGLVLWFLPVADPGGSAWEGGYVSSPLWYLRALLWLFLLSPLLLRLFRRWPVATLVGPAVAVVVLDLVGRQPAWVVPGLPDLVWQAGDIALYAVFLVLGFAHRLGRLERLSPSGWLAVIVASGAAAAAWMLTQPVPGLVVNNSHPAHLLVGLAWLGAIMMARPWLERLARAPRAGAAVAWVTQRTMTIYLWHAAALLVTRHALARLGDLPAGIWSAGLVAGTAAVMTVVVLVFGWIEDRAGGRPARLWPGTGRALAADGSTGRRPAVPARARRFAIPAATGLAAVVLASSVAGGASAEATSFRAPVPSQAPPRATFKVASAGAAVTGQAVQPSRLFARVGQGIVWSPRTLAPAVPSDLAGALQGEIEQWGDEEAVPGAQVGVLLPRQATWTGAFGTDPFAPGPVTVASRFDLTSATKSFTAALVYQLADVGLVAFDGPLPALDAVPGFRDHATMTPRQLLGHRSGLVNYRDTPAYRADPLGIDTAEEAVAAAVAQPRTSRPGVRAEYSSTNYLVLSLLVGQASGRTFDELLAEWLLRPLRLTRTSQLPPGPGAPNSGTSGVVTDPRDLLRWGAAAYRDRAVSSDRSFADMAGIDPASSLGPGTVGMCPCGKTPGGKPWWEWIGYTGSTTAVLYSAARDMVFVIRVTDDLWQPGRFDTVLDLATRLDDLISRGRD